MNAQLLKALYAKPAPVILGRRLRPFSLAHRLALTAMGSPFMERDAPITPADLIAALRICALHDPFRPLTAPSWRDKFQAGRLRHSPSRLERAGREFLAYVDDHTAHPDLWQPPKKAPDSGIPWPALVATNLVANGLPDAWHMSEGLAVWHYCALVAVNGGGIRVKTEAEARAFAMLEKLNAAQKS